MKKSVMLISVFGIFLAISMLNFAIAQNETNQTTPSNEIMPNLKYNDKNGRAICERMLEQIKRCSSYKETDSILAIVQQNFTAVEYWTAETQQAPDQTQFSINIKGETCDILSFDVAFDLRRQGIGRQMYLAIEKLAEATTKNAKELFKI